MFKQFKMPSLPALAVLLLVITAFFLNLGDTSLPSQDDAYQAQLTKEMMQRGDFIGITYGGSYSFQSSPLFNWLMADSYLIFGVNEFSARFPSALLAVATILLVFFWSRKQWGEQAATMAAFILLTSSLFLRYGRHAMAEVPLAFFAAVAYIAFIEAQERKKFYLLWGLAAGFAVLTKSALGMLPIGVGGLFLLISEYRKDLINRYFLGGIVVFIAIICIWYVPAILTYGEIFLESHFGAYLGSHTFSGHHVDMGIAGYFYYLLWWPIQYLPWTIALVPALGMTLYRWKKNPPLTFLALGIVITVAGLSLITTKYTRYLMQIFPISALLIAGYWHDRIPEKLGGRIVKVLGVISAVAAAVLIIFPIPLDWDRNDEIRQLAPTVTKLANEGQEIYNFGLSHFEYQNPLLFYTDHTFTQRIDDPVVVYEGLMPGDRRLVLTDYTGYTKVFAAAPKEVTIKEESVIGTLVLMSITSPGEADWIAELSPFQELINHIEDSEYLGTWGIPREQLYILVRENFSKRLIPLQERPKLTHRVMEKRGTRTGIAWRGEHEKLLGTQDFIINTKFLAYSEHFVIFQFLPVEEAQ